MTTPLLLISDAPTAGSGLGRVTSDIASRIAKHLPDVYRVACCGYGGINSRSLPYHYYTAEGMKNDWIIPTLPEIWHDWAGEEKGAILFISDPSRLGWFSRPETNDDLVKYPALRNFLLNPPFQKWIYAPVDASGPNDKLTFPLAQSLLGFDKILAYGPFGENVIRRTLGNNESDVRKLISLPHGIDRHIFYPRDRATSRASFLALTKAFTMTGQQQPICDDEILLGIVCTNQARKDLGLAFEAVSILARKSKVRLWIHCDTLERHWSIPALLLDFDLFSNTLISLEHIPDEALATAYSACDVTIAPGVEGWGFPIAESLACGIPVCHGSYGGGADILPSYMQVDPVAFRYESIWCCKRPVYKPNDWADKVSYLFGKQSFWDSRYDWNNLWPEWETWFREGIK